MPATQSSTWQSKLLTSVVQQDSTSTFPEGTPLADVPHSHQSCHEMIQTPASAHQAVWKDCMQMPQVIVQRRSDTSKMMSQTSPRQPAMPCELLDVNNADAAVLDWRVHVWNQVSARDSISKQMRSKKSAEPLLKRGGRVEIDARDAGGDIVLIVTTGSVLIYIPAYDLRNKTKSCVLLRTSKCSSSPSARLDSTLEQASSILITSIGLKHGGSNMHPCFLLQMFQGLKVRALSSISSCFRLSGHYIVSLHVLNATCIHMAALPLFSNQFGLRGVVTTKQLSP